MAGVSSQRSLSLLQELRGRQPAPGGVVPADQRLAADQALTTVSTAWYSTASSRAVQGAE